MCSRVLALLLLLPALAAAATAAARARMAAKAGAAAAGERPSPDGAVPGGGWQSHPRSDRQRGAALREEGWRAPRLQAGGGAVPAVPALALDPRTRRRRRQRGLRSELLTRRGAPAVPPSRRWRSCSPQLPRRRPPLRRSAAPCGRCGRRCGERAEALRCTLSGGCCCIGPCGAPPAAWSRWPAASSTALPAQRLVRCSPGGRVCMAGWGTA